MSEQSGAPIIIAGISVVLAISAIVTTIKTNDSDDRKAMEERLAKVEQNLSKTVVPLETYQIDQSASSKQLSEISATLSAKANIQVVDNIGALLKQTQGSVSDIQKKIASLDTGQAKLIVNQMEIPKGTVAFFDLRSCPSGWEEFVQARGRFLLGANLNRSNGLSARFPGRQGGAESHTLTTAELPAHRHSVHWTDNRGAPIPATEHMPGRYGNANRGTNTGAVGGGLPHNNMPPFHVLLQCKKV